MDTDRNAPISAFSEDHVERLTGLSKGQLRAWDRAGFFAPHFAYEDRHAPYSRVYSFQDVVGLRTIAVLMKEHRVSLQQLRKVAQELVRRGFPHWASVKLYVVKGQVHFSQPDSGEVEGVWDGQLAMLPVIDVINDVETQARSLQQRTPRSDRPRRAPQAHRSELDGDRRDAHSDRRDTAVCRSRIFGR